MGESKPGGGVCVSAPATACEVSEEGCYHSRYMEVAQIFRIGNNINI